MSTKRTTDRLKSSKQHRAAYVASQVNIGIPFQIRALRKQRKWDQKRLASEAEMAQPRISAMEKPGYGSFTLETLKRLANAFDVGLVVRFAPFSELMKWSDQFSPDDFQILGFEQDLETIEEPQDNATAYTFVVTVRNQVAANESVEDSPPQYEIPGTAAAFKQVASGG